MANSPDSKARITEIDTAHGVLMTPVFAPVGTQATVRTVTPDELRAIDLDLIVANTYHLYLRPGVDVIQKIGGIHRFMAWEKVVLTDSGGYQVFSLAKLRKITDEGIKFRSHIDGSQHFITPQLAIKLEEALGGDIIMVLDECPQYTENYDEVKLATDRTHRWAVRCKQARSSQGQRLFAIVQGGTFVELRKQSAEFLTSLDFDGYAIGGLCLGEPRSVMRMIVGETITHLPINKPRYLMGVGSPVDIVESIHQGIDLFDSALPTQIARRGALYTWQGRRNIRKTMYKDQDTPFDPECSCYTCRHFSAAYLNHLFRSQELLAYRLATLHNLTFMAQLITRIRNTILDGTFMNFRNEFLAGYRSTEDTVRTRQKRKQLESRINLT